MAEIINNQSNTVMYPNEDKYYNEWANDRDSNALYPTWLRENYPEVAAERAAAKTLPAIDYNRNGVFESGIKPTFATFEDYQKFLKETYGSLAAQEAPIAPAAIEAPAPALEAASTSAPEQLLSGKSDLTFPNLKIDSQFSAPAPAAPTSVLGMFPEVDAMQRALYQQKQNEAMQAQAMQYASLDPMARAQYSLYLGGQQLGGAIGGALGAKDPQLQMIALTQQIAQGTDLSNPLSIYQAAQKFAQIGNLPLATAYADRAKVLQESLAKTGKEAAEAVKITQETTSKTQTVKALMDKFQLSNVDAAAIASNPDLLKSYLTPKSAQGFKLLETGKYTPESITKWTDEGGDLEPIDKMAKPDGTFLAKAQELKIGVKPKFGDYSSEEVGKINAAMQKDQTDLAAARATSIRISNNVQQEKAFSEKRGTTQATELDTATNMARGASQALNTIRNMKELNDSGQLFTGPVAQSYVGATNLLSSLNLLSPAQAKMLTSSQVYDKQAKDLVMNELAGKLGAGISEGDRKFIEDRIPQLTTSPTARKELLNKIESLQQDKINYWKKMTAHANKHNNLNDFDFSENYSPAATVPSGSNWSIKPKP